MSTTVVAIAAGLVLVVGFVAKLAAQGGKVAQYFENAVRAYLWAEDAPAGLRHSRRRKRPRLRSREFCLRT